MVWVNPPNRFNYIVIVRLRNVHSRKLSKFDDPRSKMFNHRATIKVAKFQLSISKQPKVLFENWNLDLGISRALFRCEPAHLPELQLTATPLRSLLLGSLSSIG